MVQKPSGPTAMPTTSCMIVEHLCPWPTGRLSLVALRLRLNRFVSGPVANWTRRDMLPAIAGLVLIVGALLFVIVVVPQAAVDSRGLSRSDWLTHVDNVRASILQGLGGLALLGTLYFSTTTLGLNRRGQLADRFTKAVEQLGQVNADNMAVRLGGIYALEQIALDDDDFHWPVMEVLTAVLRATADPPSPADRGARRAVQALSTNGFPEPTDECPRPRLRTDLQAIASVICRRTEARRRASSAEVRYSGWTEPG